MEVSLTTFQAVFSALLHPVFHLEQSFGAVPPFNHHQGPGSAIPRITDVVRPEPNRQRFWIYVFLKIFITNNCFWFLGSLLVNMGQLKIQK